MDEYDIREFMRENLVLDYEWDYAEGGRCAVVGLRLIDELNPFTKVEIYIPEKNRM